MSENKIQQTNSELRKPEYWVGHLILVLSTVIGVYLAAETGFRKAVEFDLLQAEINNYHLRTSLHGELSDNLESMEKLAIFFGQQGIYDAGVHRSHKQDFIWESMKFSQATLETPAPILSKIRRYYAELDGVFNRLDSKQIRESFARRELRRVNELAKTDALPLLESNLLELHEFLKQRDVELPMPAFVNQP